MRIENEEFNIEISDGQIKISHQKWRLSRCGTNLDEALEDLLHNCLDLYLDGRYKDSSFHAFLKKVYDNMKYFLDSDNDGHWFIVPAEKRKEWKKWVNSENWEVPEYVTPLNKHISFVLFENPEII